MAHLYTIGSVVTCNVISGHFAGKTDFFTVEAQMPPVGTSLQYRIKSQTESFRRVVSEHQLSALDVPSAPQLVAAPRWHDEES